MTIVGIDTSMAHTSACVLAGDGAEYATAVPSAARLFEPPEHSAELLPALSELLDQAAIGWHDIESIGIGVGPGTFTGLRIGIATARALGQALDVPLAPVSSLQALAAGLAPHAKQDTPLLSLIDARRREVFAALYRAGEQPDAAPVLQWGPLALSPDELLSRIAELAAPPAVAGDWAVESRSRLEAAGAQVPPDDCGVHGVSAAHVCRLAAGTQPVEANQVEPVYVRLPDAEINLSAVRGGA